MTPGMRRPSAGHDLDCECQDLIGKVGDDTCDKVLLEVCRANKLGLAITIWDLPRVTGLQLHAAFAAVRTLESGRILVVGDDPSNPFGATLQVRSTAAARLNRLRVA